MANVLISATAVAAAASATATSTSVELELAGSTGIAILVVIAAALIVDGIVDAWRYRNWRRDLYNRKNPKWWEK